LGHLDTKPYSPAEKSYPRTWNETDLTLSYTRDLGLFKIGGGYTYVGFAALNPDEPDRNDLQELSLTVSLNTLLSPTLVIIKEVGHSDYWYFKFGISQVFSFSKMISLNLAASASYLLGIDAVTVPKFDNNSVAMTDKFSNFHDGSVSMGLPINVTDHITITPTLAYIFPLTNEARYEIKALSMKGTATPADRESSFIIGGTTVSFTF